MYLNVKKLLDELRIEYRTSGSNIGRGWYGIKQCPFCGDRRHHLGVHVKSANLKCWKCGTKVWMYDYIMEVYKCQRNEAKRICHPFIDFKKSGIDEKEADRPSRLRLPYGISNDFKQCHIQYLEKRNFPLEVIQRFSLMFCHVIPPYKYRIIMPIFYDEKMVSFTGRAISDVMEPRYLNCPNEESVIPVKQCVYNIDMVIDHIIVCEGPTDCWRMGTGAVATFGTQFTNRQINYMRKKGVERATILYDPDSPGKRAARLMESSFDLLGIDSQVMTLEGKDPGALTEDEVMDLKKEIYK